MPKIIRQFIIDLTVGCIRLIYSKFQFWFILALQYAYNTNLCDQKGEILWSVIPLHSTPFYSPWDVNFALYCIAIMKAVFEVIKFWTKSSEKKNLKSCFYIWNWFFFWSWIHSKNYVFHLLHLLVKFGMWRFGKCDDLWACISQAMFTTMVQHVSIS